MPNPLLSIIFKSIQDTSTKKKKATDYFKGKKEKLNLIFAAKVKLILG